MKIDWNVYMHKSLLLFVLLIGFGVLLLSNNAQKKDGIHSVSRETAYDKVMRTGVIRCGYAAWDPILNVDPETGEVTGIAHDVIEEAAKIIGIEVQWTEESNWGEYVASLSNGRFDVFCAGPTPNSERARELLFTEPFMFTRFALYARFGDTRFDNRPDLINRLESKIAVLDGTTSVKIIRESFPEATRVNYPESIPFSNLLVEVALGKADLTLQPAFAGGKYMSQNPDRLKVIKGFEDFRVLENVFMVDNDEFKLRELLNEAIDELRVSGKLDTIIARHEIEEGLFYRLPNPYQYRNCKNGNSCIFKQINHGIIRR